MEAVALQILIACGVIFAISLMAILVFVIAQGALENSVIRSLFFRADTARPCHKCAHQVGPYRCGMLRDIADNSPITCQEARWPFGGCGPKGKLWELKTIEKG